MKKVLSLLAILIASTGFSYSQSKVADIEFGKTSYEEAIPKLKYKFGEPTMDDDEGRIVIFSDIYYAGQKFDKAWFFFESTTTYNVFNKCWLYSCFRTAKEAKEFREEIVAKLRDKYKVTEEIDLKTKFKKYNVGISPTDSTKPYMVVSAGRFGDNGYSAGISYGPFEYINENF